MIRATLLIIIFGYGLSGVLFSAPINNVIGDLVGLKKLPAHGFSIVENEFGDLYLISDSGRFAIQKPKIYDVWNGTWINKLSDLKSNRVDLDKMGLNIDELKPFKFGKAKKRITVFLDPVSLHTKKLLSFVNKNTEKYSWNIVMFPSQGQKSAIAARKILCDPDPKRSYTALTTQDLSKLKPTNKCNTFSLQKTLVISRYLGINRLPYTINANGFITTGYIDEKTYQSAINK